MDDELNKATQNVTQPQPLTQTPPKPDAEKVEKPDKPDNAEKTEKTGKEDKDDTNLLKAMNYNYKRIKELIEETKDFDLNTTKANFQTFKANAKVQFNNRLTKSKSLFAEKLNNFKARLKHKLEALHSSSRLSDCQLDPQNYEIPNENFTLDEIKKTFERLDKLKSTAPTLLRADKENKETQELLSSLALPTFKSIDEACVLEVENLVRLIKKFSDNDKVSQAFTTMETIVYRKFLDERRELTQVSVNEKTQLITKKIREELGELKGNFLPSKLSGHYFLHESPYFVSAVASLRTEKIITETCQKSYTIDSVFAAFNTYDQTPFIAWTNTTTVDVFDLAKDKQVQSLKGHNQHIYIVRHFFDARLLLDFLLSTSYDKKAIVWKYSESSKEFALHLSINTGHSGLYLYSGLLLFDTTSEKAPNDTSLVITSVPHEQHKVFNFKGTLLRHIGNKNDYTYFINSYFDKKKNAFFIINANSQNVKVLDFKDGATVKVFKEENVTWHMSAFVSTLNEVDYLFESDGGGCVRIWEYETVKLFKKIRAASCALRGILLWNDKVLVAASSDKGFKVFDLDSQTDKEKESTIETVVCHDNVLCTVGKIFHPKLGECLLTCAIDGKLKMFSAVV